MYKRQAQAVEAVHAVGALDRRRVRQAFDLRYSAHAMASAYVAQYARLAGGSVLPPHGELCPEAA